MGASFNNTYYLTLSVDQESEGSLAGFSGFWLRLLYYSGLPSFQGLIGAGSIFKIPLWLLAGFSPWQAMGLWAPFLGLLAKRLVPVPYHMGLSVGQLTDMLDGLLHQSYQARDLERVSDCPPDGSHSLLELNLQHNILSPWLYLFVASNLVDPGYTQR